MQKFISAGLILGFIFCLTKVSETNNISEPEHVEPKVEIVEKTEILDAVQLETYKVRELTEDELNEQLYWDSMEYVAMCVEAEAGNQDVLGKAYVCDCILNRWDTGKYDTLYDIIDEKGQFQCVSNGSINCVPSEETYQVVAQELANRTNSEILYFRTNYYHSFGTNCFQYGSHYFSK